MRSLDGTHTLHVSYGRCCPVLSDLRNNIKITEQIKSFPFHHDNFPSFCQMININLMTGGSCRSTVSKIDENYLVF